MSFGRLLGGKAKASTPLLSAICVNFWWFNFATWNVAFVMLIAKKINLEPDLLRQHLKGPLKQTP
jgi:hypothetical protein